MEYIIKAEEKEKVMIEIWKKIDKTFFPQTTENKWAESMQCAANETRAFKPANKS